MSSSKRKKERRRMRYLRNVRKEVEYKKEAWDNGKLIEENHNNGPYSPGYSVELGERLCNIIYSYKEQVISDPNLMDDFQKNELILKRFRMYRIKIRDFILHFNPNIPKTEAYEYLKSLIECYWDNPSKLIYII